MPIYHLSINAVAPERTAAALATIMGGRAMPFPPFPDAWIAFAAEDDGTAIEVLSQDTVLTRGVGRVEPGSAVDSRGATFVHLALSTPLSIAEVEAIAKSEDWPARICDRGPFKCLEVWIDGRLLVEVLDAEMAAHYREGMTMAAWSRMFAPD